MTTPIEKVIKQKKTINNIEVIYNYPENYKVYKLKRYYPKVCICFDGEIKKNMFNDFIKKVIPYITKGRNNFSDMVLDHNVSIPMEKLSVFRFFVPVEGKKLVIETGESSLDITMTNTKKMIESSIKHLKEFYNTKNFSEPQKIEINKIIEIHKLELSRSKEEEGRIRFKIDYRPLKEIKEASFLSGDFIKNEYIDGLFKMFDSFDLKGKGYSCDLFKFDAKKYRLLGGFVLPINVIKIVGLEKNKSASDLIKRVGTPFLNQVNFEIKKSSIGLREIEVRYSDNNYYLEVKTKFKFKKMENILLENYLITKGFILLIMDKKR